MDNDSLRTISHSAADLLQQIQDECGRELRNAGRVRFPRGYLRTRTEISAGLPKLSETHLERNIAYALIMADLFRWLHQRTTLMGTASEMVIKEYICILGSVAESLTKDWLKGKIGAKRGFKDRSERLVTDGVLLPSEKAEVDWLWDMRNGEHLFLLEQAEYQTYTSQDWDRAEAAFSMLCKRLREPNK